MEGSAEKGFKMAFMMINSCEIILENKNNFFVKNHCEIQVHTILVCALYSIKYGNFFHFLPFFSPGASGSGQT
jgi:hypothetical protein